MVPRLASAFASISDWFIGYCVFVVTGRTLVLVLQLSIEKHSKLLQRKVFSLNSRKVDIQKKYILNAILNGVEGFQTTRMKFFDQSNMLIINMHNQ